MSLKDTLSQNKGKLLHSWLDGLLQDYPKDTRRFFFRVKNQFQNPVGQTFAEQLEVLLDRWLADRSKEELCEPLRQIIKIRSIQELPPSQAVDFVFRLKKLVTNELADLGAGDSRELREIETQIDEMALCAFDIYFECREILYKIRVDEVRRNVSGLMRRLNAIDEKKAAGARESEPDLHA